MMKSEVKRIGCDVSEGSIQHLPGGNKVKP
jgi:hypothetical protein